MIIDVSKLPDEVRGWPYAARDLDGGIYVYIEKPNCQLFSGWWHCNAVPHMGKTVPHEAVLHPGDEHWTDSLTDLRPAWAELEEPE